MAQKTIKIGEEIYPVWLVRISGEATYHKLSWCVESETIGPTGLEEGCWDYREAFESPPGPLADLLDDFLDEMTLRDGGKTVSIFKAYAPGEEPT